MKLYLSTGDSVLTRHVYESAQDAAMTLDNVHQHGSRYANVSHVIEFNGYGSEHIHSARRPNTRDYYVRQTEYAATWDQWGVLLSRLFVLDHDMIVGSYKYPYYRGADDFGFRTGYRFDRVFSLQELPDYHGDHRFKHAGVVGEKRCTTCNAVLRWVV